MRFLRILPGIVFCFYSLAQNRTSDSLKLVLEDLSGEHDTTRCNVLGALIAAESDDAVWHGYNKQIISLCELNLNKTSPGSPEYKAFRKHYAIALNNEGYFIKEKGDIPKALEYFDRCLKIQEEAGDKNEAANSLINIGAIFDKQGDTQKALEYYNKSLKLYEETGNKKGIALALNNTGVIYGKRGDDQKALQNYNRSLSIQEEIGDKLGVTYSNINIGAIFDNQGDFSKALEYYSKNLKIPEADGSKSMAVSLNHIGGIYFKQKNYEEARRYAEKSLELSRKLGYPENIRNAARLLHKIYKSAGNHKTALHYYEMYVQMRDSLKNEATRKASIKSQLKYEYEKQAAADSVAHAKESEIKNAEIARQNAEIKAKKNQQYALFGGLALVIIFAGLMYNRFKITQKQKEIIEFQKQEVEDQKLLVEEKQKEILDSIYYARRIQKAHLPSEKYLVKIFTG